MVSCLCNVTYYLFNFNETLGIYLHTFIMSVMLTAGESKVTYFTEEKYDYKRKFRLNNQMKFIILFELLLGFNRLYLLPCKNITFILSYIFAILNVSIIFYFSWYTYDNHSFIIQSASYCYTVTHIIFVLFSFRKTKLLQLFQSIAAIDEQTDVFKNVPSSAKNLIIFTAVAASFSLVKYVFLVISLPLLCGLDNVAKKYVGTMIYSTASSIELVFYSTLLWFIYTRVSVIKAQIEVLYSINNKIPHNYKKSKGHSSIYKSHQRVNTLYRAYAKLHDCSSLLSSLFGIPVSSFSISLKICSCCSSKDKKELSWYQFHIQ